MDDLDHSMHIADYDWVNFDEECEECGLLQPSLACPDNSSLSDSEDSENPGSVFNAGRQQPQQSPAYDGARGDAEGCSTEDESCSGSIQISARLNQRNTGARQTDLTRKAEEDGEEWSPSAEDAPTELVTVEGSDETSTELQKGDGDVPQESDTSDLKSKQEADPSSCKHTHENVRESHITEGAVSEDVGTAGVRAERERWFVTVNDSPARQRVCAASVKKKRRPKKPCKDKHMFRPGDEICFNQDINRDKNESEGKRDREQDSGVNLSAGTHLQSIQTGSIPDVCVRTLPFLEQNMLQEQVMSHSLTENANEPTTDTHKAAPENNICTLEDTPLSGSVESDEFEDGVEFLSTCDSESYLSASESVEGHLFMEGQQPNLTESDNTQDGGMHSSDSTPLGKVSAISCHESTGDQTRVEPTHNFPSARCRANKMPDDNSTCNDDTRSAVLSMPSDTPEHQAPTGFNLSASGCSIGDQPGSSPLPAPDLTLTPCSVTDSPETYAEAVGNARPVYAISAFWDEMEKLTINDILQLRMGGSTPPGDTYDTQETVSPNGNAADAPTHSSSVVDSVDYNMSDSGVMDTSDAADSDYFTQLDESKPDRSSCDFSTSDFEEEYWQYIGASRNPSPDLAGKSQQTDSDFLDEEGSIISEGKDTPVPPEDLEGCYFEGRDLDAFGSCDFAWPRQITKSKSMHNVHALNTNNPVEGLFLQSFQSSHQSVDEDALLKMSDSLEIVPPTPILSYRDILHDHYQISFPEVVEHFFTENKPTYDAMSVSVYDLDDISVDPVYNYATHKLPFTSFCESQYAEQTPIPIFTCSPPTVRELTFPKPDYVFLAANCAEEDDISPIRVVSHSLIRGFDFNTSAADKIGSGSWKSLLSIRKIRFHDKGSIWCGRSGAWVFPAEDEKRSVNRVEPPIAVLGERRFSSAPSQLFGELTARQSVLEALQTSTNRQGIFSTIKQSDMCLVCIAFASWVLRSSDPEATDTWKAALLANVSALSAIQYLRQYVKKKKPPQDDP